MKPAVITVRPAAGQPALFLPVAARMVELHPYEMVYFNRFAGADMQTVKSRFDLDYWGCCTGKGWIDSGQ